MSCLRNGVEALGADALAAADDRTHLTRSGENMNNFGLMLQSQLEAKQDRSASDNQILGILQAPDSHQKERRVRRMERHVRRHLGFTDTEQIDWSSIDWSKVLSVVLQLLAALLPLLLAL